MGSEALSRRVASPTLGTAVWLFGRVAELVLLQVAHLEETLPTAGARVAPLSGLRRHCWDLGAPLHHHHRNCFIWNHLGPPTTFGSLRPWGRGRASSGCVQSWGQVMKAPWFSCQTGAPACGWSCRCCFCCGWSISGCLLLLLPPQLLLFSLLFCVSSSSSWNSRLQCCHLLRQVFSDDWFVYKIR